LGQLGTAATNRPIVPARGEYDDGEIGGMIGRGNRSTYLENTCPNAPLSTTNPTCCPVGNPGRRSGKPTTNRLSYARPYFNFLQSSKIDAIEILKKVYIFCFRGYNPSRCNCCLSRRSFIRRHFSTFHLTIYMFRPN
jgi:hypothetical protein